MSEAQDSVLSDPTGLRTSFLHIRQAVAPYGPSLLIATLYLLCAQILAVSRGDAVSVSVVGYVQQLGLILPILLIVWAIAQFGMMLAVEKPASPLSSFGRKLAVLLFDGQRWGNAIPFLVVITLTSTAYSYFKSTIPYLQPFAWDPYFDRMDMWLHGGVRPWELLQPVLGWPLVSFAVNFVYNLWFFVMIGVWLWLAFTLHKKAARREFLLAFLLTWMIGGSVLATVFSSAGPCYYAHLIPGADPYTGLMTYLQGVDGNWFPIWALNTQDMLWQGYIDPANNLSGISAMPSMHMATATLLVPLAFRMDRRIGWAAVVFWLMILIGSVHLGWHYAVDSYAGAAIAAASWWLACRLVDNRDTDPA